MTHESGHYVESDTRYDIHVDAEYSCKTPGCSASTDSRCGDCYEYHCEKHTAKVLGMRICDGCRA